MRARLASSLYRTRKNIYLVSLPQPLQRTRPTSNTAHESELETTQDESPPIPAQSAEQIQYEVVRWKKVITESNIKSDE